MPDFRERNEHELARLSDEQLIAYVRAARAAGRIDAARPALQILAWGMEPDVRRVVRLRLDKAGGAVQDEVAEQALFDAIRSAVRFEQQTVGQFRAFVFQIVRRRIADFVRKGRLDRIPLEFLSPKGESGEGDIPVSGEQGAVELQSVVDQALAELSDVHRRVIELYQLQGHSAAETAEPVERQFADAGGDSMTDQNVLKIASRFRQRVRELLREAEDDD